MSRPIVVNAVIAAVFATLVLSGSLLIGVVDKSVVLDAYMLVLGAIVIVACVRATRTAAGTTGERSALEAALQRPPEPRSRPRELERVEREVDLSLANAFYVHYRLRPLAREIAAHRLATRHGIALDASGSPARAALPDEAWELLRADRPEPRDYNAPGFTLRRLRTLVETLERI